MSTLAVIERNGVLVVDHRLVAQELGIKPKNGMALRKAQRLVV